MSLIRSSNTWYKGDWISIKETCILFQVLLIDKLGWVTSFLWTPFFSFPEQSCWVVLCIWTLIYMLRIVAWKVWSLTWYGWQSSREDIITLIITQQCGKYHDENMKKGRHGTQDTVLISSLERPQNWENDWEALQILLLKTFV